MRTIQKDLYRESIRQIDFGCHIPNFIQNPEMKALKTMYLKHNMDQLKVIKKNKDLDSSLYTNERGYVFLAPVESPLDRQIILSGGRIFEYNVDHQQKRHSKENSIDAIEINNSFINSKRSFDASSKN